MKFFALIALLAVALPTFALVTATHDLKLDFRYSPHAWDTLLAFPDDWQKAMVNDQGTLLLDYPGPYLNFATTVSMGVDGFVLVRSDQHLVAAKVPIVVTELTGAQVSVHQEMFSVVTEPGPRVVAFSSDFTGGAFARPILTIDSQSPITFDTLAGVIQINQKPFLFTRPRAELIAPTPTGVRLVFSSAVKHIDTITVQGAEQIPLVGDLETEKVRANAFWLQASLPWDQIHVPDPQIQALLESSVRNIYQARELKDGVPEYRTGPSVYRSIFVVDGAFIFEVATWLGDVSNVRQAIDHIMSKQQASGQVVVMSPDFLKETGIMLWTIRNHARLTQDKPWLREQWPKVESAVEWITRTLDTTAQDPTLPYAGLMPPGYADGGIDGVKAEYTNTYWSMSGFQAAIEAAEWLGQSAEAVSWKSRYAVFKTAFQKAASRDVRKTSSGIPYLPILMNSDPKTDIPQKAQWAFCQAIFPGKIFAHDDPLMKGTLGMLDSFSSEGLVLNTGWLNQGIWTYFGSFYAHAHLWQGDFAKAQDILYAFGNHASPLLTWREEQMPVGKGSETIGDMPHNWASAEFIRLVRHLIALERGEDFDFLQGVPDAWLVAGADLSLKQMASEFGKLNFSLKISTDGNLAEVNLAALGTSDESGAPVIHLEGLQRMGFKAEDGADLPSSIRGVWGQDFTLKMVKTTR